jgi:hypothetical protein
MTAHSPDQLPPTTPEQPSLAGRPDQARTHDYNCQLELMSTPTPPGPWSAAPVLLHYARALADPPAATARAAPHLANSMNNQKQNPDYSSMGSVPWKGRRGAGRAERRRDRAPALDGAWKSSLRPEIRPSRYGKR